MSRCYAKGCKNSSLDGVKMNYFPSDPLRRSTWVNNCQIYGGMSHTWPEGRAALCEYHFAADMWEKPRVDGKKKLKFNAKPTIFGDSVLQVAQRYQKIPRKAIDLNTVMVLTTDSSKGIQVLTPAILWNKEIASAKKSRINVYTSENSHQADEQVSFMTGKSTHLILDNNIFLPNEDVSIEVPSDTTLNNDSFLETQTNLQVIQEKETNSAADELLTEEEWETDSFIEENFEPVTYEELNAAAGNNEVIEESEIDSVIIEDNQSVDLQVECETTSDQTSKKCSNCKRLEKLYLKSERIREMMKVKAKARYSKYANSIHKLQNRIEMLEGSQSSLRQIFNEDQIAFLSKNRKKTPKWSDDTMKKANFLKDKIGIKAYQVLLDQNWPLPSLRTLRTKPEERLQFCMVDARIFDS